MMYFYYASVLSVYTKCHSYVHVIRMFKKPMVLLKNSICQKAKPVNLHTAVQMSHRASICA